MAVCKAFQTMCLDPKFKMGQFNQFIEISKAIIYSLTFCRFEAISLTTSFCCFLQFSVPNLEYQRMEWLDQRLRGEREQ